MDNYVTGAAIRSLRESKGLTQEELAEHIHVSAKAVSKWETGKGFPDISLLEPLAKALDISVIELLSGQDIRNRNRAFNMLKSVWYICPACGNVIKQGTVTAKKSHAMGEWVVTAEATCTQTGSKTRQCVYCDFTETQIIEKTKHTDADQDGKCDDCGSEVTPANACPICGKTEHNNRVTKVFHAILAFIK